MIKEAEDQSCDHKTRQKCNSFYKEAFLNREKYIELLEKENERLSKCSTELKNWLEENTKDIKIESMSGGISTDKKRFYAQDILDKISELENNC